MPTEKLNETRLNEPTLNQPISEKLLPNAEGYIGPYGGQLIPPHLKVIMNEIATAYLNVRETAAFQDELKDLYQHYVGRPSPIYYAKRLSEACGGAKIYLKREDLNHTGAHKINHAQIGRASCRERV